MTLTTAAFDLEMHCWMLKLSSNLITGIYYDPIFLKRVVIIKELII